MSIAEASAVPSAAAVTALLALVETGVPDREAALLRDPRVPAEQWKRVLDREWAHLLSWAARRRVTAAGGGVRGGEPSGAGPVGQGPVGEGPEGAGPAGGATRCVLALLPRHGFAVHLIRRAVPYALCGLPVEVAAAAAHAAELRRVVAAVGGLLGLDDDVLRQTPDPVAAVEATGPAHLVVLTGHPATRGVVGQVTARTGATLRAATGGCVLAVGRHPAQVRDLARVLVAHSWPNSCTRFGGAFVVADPTDPAAEAVPVEVTPVGVTPLVTAPVPPSLPEGSWGAVVRAAHPSAVFALDDLDAPPGDVAGYPVLPVDTAATVGTLRGFGRDPVGGWPGDFDG